MNQGKYLIKKATIYAIGNIGSKVLSYVMVLVYSHYILAEDMGDYDLILTTVSMLQPLVSFQISDGVYRFLQNSYIDKTLVLSTAFRFLCGTSLVATSIFGIIAVLNNSKYSFWMVIYLITILFYFFFHDAIRGLEETKKYALIGIINSIIMLIVEIIGLIVFKLGIVALLSASVISMMICIIIMIVWQPEFKHIFRRNFDKQVFNSIIKYSVPLVPNTVCWWVVNSSDRYIILAFLGTSFNGIYSISNKFPTVLTTITGIFYLAWQESAIKEYNSPNRDSFFSSVFQKYYILLFTLTICAIPMTHIVIDIFVGDDYNSAWRYVGFLYLGTIFSALCSFLGLGYQISRETVRSMYTTIVAAGINIVVNIILINFIGLHAASFSTFVAYFFLFLIRVRHTKRYFTLIVDWKEFYVLLVLSLLVNGTILLFNNLILSVSFLMFGVCHTVVMNKKLLLPIYVKMMKNRRL